MDDQRKNKPRRGTMVVEAALILPLLLILTFGGIKYGWLFIKWQQINNVARHSVRQAIRPGDTTTQTNTLIATLMTNVGMGSIGYGGVDGAPMVTGAASAVGSPVVVEIGPGS
ncbi:MAG: TadE/TadG family type IV pilus assembly protein [Planctomycetota bacterium]|jgi:Flp pilus assembly protein TadG